MSTRGIEELSGEKVSACYQCEKCSNGCPLTEAMDISPSRLMHCLQLGLTDEVLGSDTIWVCASCETCTTRCPNEIDVSHVMDALRRLSVLRGVKPSQRQTPIFHEVFLANIRRFGRVYEANLAVQTALKSRGMKGLYEQAGLGLKMLSKGKLRPIPGRMRAGREVKAIFQSAKKGG